MCLELLNLGFKKYWASTMTKRDKSTIKKSKEFLKKNKDSALAVFRSQSLQ